MFVDMASYIVCCGASGGSRWSMPDMPVKPAASAARARPTRSSSDMRICGRKRWNSGGTALPDVAVRGAQQIAHEHRLLRRLVEHLERAGVVDLGKVVADILDGECPVELHVAVGHPDEEADDASD